jgi:ABC-type multidrug transport system fused ATPase/permease subunit
VRHSHRSGLSRLTTYLQGRRLAVFGLVLVATGQAICQTGGWLLVRAAIDNGIGDSNSEYLTVVVVIYILVGAVGWVLSATLIRGLAGIGQGIVLGLRRDLFEHLTSLSPTLAANVVLLPTAIVVVFIVDWRLGMISFIVLPPALVLTRWFQRTSSVAQLEVRNRIAAVTAHMAESVAGMAIVQAFNRERAFQDEFDSLNEENRRANVHTQTLLSCFFPSIELLGLISTTAVLLLGAHLYVDGDISIGTLITAMYLLQLVFQPLQELSDVYSQMQSAAAAMVKISSVLDAESDIGDRPGAGPMPQIDGRLQLDRIRFAYGDNEVLHGVGAEVAAGGCLALVGQSGGGKSTVAKLIARFYDPVEGAVRVDGIDVRDVQLRSYRRQLGVVLQDPFLFSGTIADNIRFARPDATDEQVRDTAAAVGVDRIAVRLNGGLDHVVREGGAGLSAGERQLISIARALLADPRILILDEATSNIDRPTEIQIERALDRLLRGRTSVIIAHRLATVRRADEILVVDHGNVIQRGSESDLLAVDGPFQRLAHGLRSVG